MSCPNCGGKIIGRIGVNQYYCWDCFIEFSNINGRVQAYQVESDGTLVSILEENKQVNSEFLANRNEVAIIGS